MPSLNMKLTKTKSTVGAIPIMVIKTNLVLAVFVMIRVATGEDSGGVFFL